ncbi:Pml1p [Lachancea thermotolerans CBS 6340]|uniref:KLTH0G07788p n=1 Tax=Lachancea thermotolerans (strain ATCC 56472 / CBS 6340 / NRRL Y-8284) TaxID=559295 RepID=C5DMC7_LACTC|nr:KLTH0G07788p [Lachancea thermotolerans CBS 6340]CAR24938.1 KLTH0G07788p [Lachancea thermotolerans CBS 6340]
MRQQELGKRGLDLETAGALQPKRFRSQRASDLPRKAILPIFGPSGLLELESHSKKGIQLQHVEPHDSISPNAYFEKYKIPIRKQTHFQALLYSEKDEAYHEKFDLLERSNYLVGRRVREDPESEDEQENKETVLADIPIREETCSKQHCVIQFREREGILKAYVIDLDSSNGTLLNDVALPRARYVELKNEDVLKFSADESDTCYFLIFVAA